MRHRSRSGRADHGAARAVVTLAVVACLAACTPPGRPTHESAAPTHPVSTGAAPVDGCGQRATGGADRTLDFAVDPATSEGQSRRTALVHRPAGVAAGTPQPVLLVYHGHGGTAEGAAAATGFDPVADRAGFLVVYPQGLPDGRGGPPMWASAGPVDHGIEELPATRALLDALTGGYCVDRSRIYATGISNGGGMANYLACHLADRIAAIASVVGNMYTPKDGGCRPSRPVSILDIHAADDPIVPYDGDPGDTTWQLPAVADWLAGWAALDRCTGSTGQAYQGTGEVRRWRGCSGGSTITAYRVTGGHRWPDSLAGTPTAEAVWDFLETHRIG
ncbi:alpha/beta hydrolase family esterase [Micromonospora sp. NPDC000089]|uniref:alpha/beta hydrolase family esterase n=1 Tax=unclassified Micromonospora TaxID=2617518 RepID=UPI0036CD53A2